MREYLHVYGLACHYAISRKFRDKTSLRVINKMVVDPATQYFVKCNNNLCRDRMA